MYIFYTKKKPKLRNKKIRFAVVSCNHHSEIFEFLPPVKLLVT